VEALGAVVAGGDPARSERERGVADDGEAVDREVLLLLEAVAVGEKAAAEGGLEQVVDGEEGAARLLADKGQEVALVAVATA